MPGYSLLVRKLHFTSDLYLNQNISCGYSKEPSPLSTQKIGILIQKTRESVKLMDASQINVCSKRAAKSAHVILWTMNRRESMTNTRMIHKRGTAFKRPVKHLLEDLNLFHGANLTLSSDVDQDT